MESVTPDRTMASIVMINDIKEISGANSIELAVINGWQCVVKKGEFKIGDFGVYICIDSIPDLNDPNFSFMKEKNLKRVKTMKMMGEISQGLLGPLSWLESRNCPIDNLKEGDDVTTQMGITKYVEPEEFEQYNGFDRSESENIRFPSSVPKTDEERLQNKPKFINDILGKTIVITRKEDGCSCTFMVRNFNCETDLPNQSDQPNQSSDVAKKFDICGRNFVLTGSKGDPSTAHYFVAEKKYNIENNLLEYCNKNNKQLAIQGEIVGPKINSNKLKLSEISFRVFNIYDIDNSKYLDYDQVLNLCQILGLETVPELWRGLADDFNPNNNLTLLEMINQPNQKIQNIIKIFLDFADSICYNPGEVAEGIVIKTVNGHDRRVSFKVISNKFLLQQEQNKKEKKKTAKQTN